jgi:hypothetical protein
MADYLLMAQYPKAIVVRDRNSGGLIAWSAYTSSIDVPPAPTEDWVRERIVAEQIPLQTQIYVDRTISYFLQDPQTQLNIREYLSPWNDAVAEEALSAEIQTVIGTFMPRFAAIDVSDAQVQAWYEAHGLVPPA